MCSPALTQSSRSHPTSDIKETAGAACTLQCRPTSLVGERRRKNPTARVADSSREKICRPPFPPHNPFMTFSVPMAAHTGVGRLHTPGASLSKVRFTDACCCKRRLLLLVHYGPHSCTSKLRRQILELEATTDCAELIDLAHLRLFSFCSTAGWSNKLSLYIIRQRPL